MDRACHTRVRCDRSMSANRSRSRRTHVGRTILRMPVDLATAAYGPPAARALRDAVAAAKGGDPLAPVTVVVPTNYVGVAARRLLAGGTLGRVTEGGNGIAGVTFLTLYRLAELLGAPRLAGAGRRPVSTPVLAAAIRGRARRRRPACSRRWPSTRPPSRRSSQPTASSRDSTPGARRARPHRARGRPTSCASTAPPRLARAGWYDERDLMDAAVGARRDGFPAARRPRRRRRPPPAATSPPGGRLLRARSADARAGHRRSRATGVARADAAVRGRARAGSGSSVEPRPCARRRRRHGRTAVVIGLRPRRRGAHRRSALVDRRAARRCRRSSAWRCCSARTSRTRRLVARAARRRRHPAQRRRGAHARRQRARARAARGCSRSPTATSTATTSCALLAVGARARRRAARRRPRVGAHRRQGGDRAAARRGTSSSTATRWLEHELTRRAGGAPTGEPRPSRCEHELAPRGGAARRSSRARRRSRPRRAPRLRGASWSDGRSGSCATTSRGDGAAGRLARGRAAGGRARSRRRSTAWPASTRSRAAAASRCSAARSSSSSTTTSVGSAGSATASSWATWRSGSASTSSGSYVCGLAEGTFPAPVRDDSLLPDAERRAHRRALPLRADARRRRPRAACSPRSRPARTSGCCASPAAISVARPSACRRVSCSTPSKRSTARGRYADELAHLEADLVHAVPSFAARHRHAEFPATEQEHRMRALLDHRGAGSPAAAHDLPRRDACSARARVPLAAPAARRSRGSTATSPALADPEPDRVDAVVSPTRLESWADCPHDYFMQQILRVEIAELPEEVYELSPLDRGSLVHVVLDEFIARGARPPGGAPAPDAPWTDADRARLRAIGEECCDEYEAAGVTGRRVFWHRDRQRHARRSRPASSPTTTRPGGPTAPRPIATELRFGFRDAAAAGRDHAVRRPHAAVPGRGRPRRSRRRRHALGASTTRRARADYGARPRRPHRRAARRSSCRCTRTRHGRRSATPTTPVGAAYWFVEHQGRFRWAELRARRRRVEARVDDVLRAIVDGIERGVFPCRLDPPGRGAGRRRSFRIPTAAAPATATGSGSASATPRARRVRRARPSPTTPTPTRGPDHDASERRQLSFVDLDGDRRRATAIVARRSTRRCSSRPAPARARPRRWSTGSSRSSRRRDVPMREIAAITFTEKAAAELRDRIRARARAAGGRTADDSVAVTRAPRGARRARRRRDLHAARLRAAAPRRAPDRGRSAAAGRGARRDRVAASRSTSGGRAFVDRLLDDPTLERTVLLALHAGSRPSTSCATLADACNANWDLVAERMRAEPDPPPLDLTAVDRRCSVDAAALARDGCSDCRDDRRHAARDCSTTRGSAALERAPDEYEQLGSPPLGGPATPKVGVTGRAQGRTGALRHRRRCATG